MLDDELIEYIFKGTNHPIVSKFRLWLNSSERFKSFAIKYSDRIRGGNKVGGAVKDKDRDEKLKDIQFELEIGYLLLKDSRFLEVEYEKDKKKGAGPDFAVTFETGTMFNVEVKRIRELDLEKRFEAWENWIAEQVGKIASKTLVIQMHISSLESTDTYEPDLLDRLENKASEIMDYIVETVPNAEADIPLGGEKLYVLRGFEGEITLEFSKPFTRQPSNRLLIRRSLRPIFYTQDEFRKFGDLICNPQILNQLPAGMINVLAITSESETHEDVDLTAGAIASLRNRITRRDDDFFLRKGFDGGMKEFLAKYRKLSALIYRNPLGTPQGSKLVINNDADCQVPEDLRKALQEL